MSQNWNRVWFGYCEYGALACVWHSMKQPFNSIRCHSSKVKDKPVGEYVFPKQEIFLVQDLPLLSWQSKANKVAFKINHLMGDQCVQLHARLVFICNSWKFQIQSISFTKSRLVQECNNISFLVIPISNRFHYLTFPNTFCLPLCMYLHPPHWLTYWKGVH